MQFKLASSFFKSSTKNFGWAALSLLGFASVANASVVITPVAPAGFNTNFIANYAGSTDPAKTAPTNGFMGPGAHFYQLNVSLKNNPVTRDDAVFFDISATDNLDVSQTWVITAGVVVNNTITVVPLASANGVSCNHYQDVTLCSANGYSAPYNPAIKDPIRVGIYPRDICRIATSVTGNYNGCTGSGDSATLNDPANSLVSVSVIFYIHKNTGTDPAPVASDLQQSITLQFQGGAGSLNCPANNLAGTYTPGDGQVTFNPGVFVPVQGTSSSPFSTLIIKANTADIITSDSAAFVNDSSYVTSLIYSGSPAVLSGLTNTTNGNDYQYSVAVNYSDVAGVIPNYNPTCVYTTANGVQTSSIQGFLKKSSCFIATAAFRSTDAAPVVLLRSFRDQVLLHSAPGRAFVSWYYDWSPSAAEWLMLNPKFRYPVLLALTPLEFFAWLLLHPIFVLSFGGMVFVAWGAYRLKNRIWVPVILFAIGAQVGFIRPAQAEESAQPYIDQLKQQLNEEHPQAAPGPGNEPYIDGQKKKIQAADPTPYIQELKESNPERYQTAPVGSYLEREREKLEGKPQGGAIQAVLEGHSEIHPQKIGEIHKAVGFRVGASESRTITAGSDIAYRSYEDVYGTGYVPELTFFYEIQPFHSEWFGNFGLIFNGGFSWKKGSGLFQFAPKISGGGGARYAQQSAVEMQFVTVPVSVGLTYRFNLLRIVRPYVMVAPTGIAYAESRNDRDDLLHGWSKGLTYGGGVSLMLDWFDRKSSWALYETAGVKQFYLTVDYLRSFANGSVNFTQDGLTAGFTFEI